MCACSEKPLSATVPVHQNSRGLKAFHGFFFAPFLSPPGLATQFAVFLSCPRFQEKQQLQKTHKLPKFQTLRVFVSTYLFICFAFRRTETLKLQYESHDLN